MKIKRIIVLIIVILVCLSIFSGCNITISDGQNNQEKETETDVKIEEMDGIYNWNENEKDNWDYDDDIIPEEFIYPVPEINPVMQNYDGFNIAEILIMSYEGENAGIEKINASILDGILQTYLQFIENQDEYSWIEIKSYPFTSDDYVQIVMTYAEYPIYGTDGEIWSYNFDVKRGVSVELGEVMDNLGFTEAMLTQKIQELYARDIREEDEFVTEAAAKGFLITGDSLYPVTKLLLKVSIQHPGADIWESFFSYIPQTDELLRLQSDLFDSNEPDKMDPPLWYERRMAYGGIELDD